MVYDFSKEFNYICQFEDPQKIEKFGYKRFL